MYDDIVFKNGSGHHDVSDTLQLPLYSNRAEISVYYLLTVAMLRDSRSRAQTREDVDLTLYVDIP